MDAWAWIPGWCGVRKGEERLGEGEGGEGCLATGTSYPVR